MRRAGLSVSLTVLWLVLDDYRHGQHIDVHLMGILRDEWLAQDRPRTWELD